MFPEKKMEGRRFCTPSILLYPTCIRICTSSPLPPPPLLFAKQGLNFPEKKTKRRRCTNGEATTRSPGVSPPLSNLIPSVTPDRPSAAASSPVDREHVLIRRVCISEKKKQMHEEMGRMVFANDYGTTFPFQLNLDQQILSRE